VNKNQVAHEMSCNIWEHQSKWGLSVQICRVNELGGAAKAWSRLHMEVRNLKHWRVFGSKVKCAKEHSRKPC
jgi:hypothetical protein